MEGWLSTVFRNMNRCSYWIFWQGSQISPNYTYCVLMPEVKHVLEVMETWKHPTEGMRGNGNIQQKVDVKTSQNAEKCDVV